jgi:RHS repeat-associated protein
MFAINPSDEIQTVRIVDFWTEESGRFSPEATGTNLIYSFRHRRGELRCTRNGSRPRAEKPVWRGIVRFWEGSSSLLLLLVRLSGVPFSPAPKIFLWKSPDRAEKILRAYAPFGEPYSSSGTLDLSFTGQNQDTVSGLYDFPQREYSPGQGRWISPDPLGIGGVKITNPRTWNRYAYALNDPLSMVDPNGECAVPGGPNGLSGGQVGVCVDLFIAAPTIGDYGIFNGVGDGRGPVSDDSSATFRVEYSFVYDSNNNMVSVSITTDPSVVSFMGGLFSASRTGDTTGDGVTGTANADGSWTVSIDTSSLNGWAGAPAAPNQPILLDLSLTIFPDGTVESDGGERSAFPSLEVWSYQPGQDPYNVLYIPESGNPNDLGSLNQDVPSTGDPSATGTQGDNPGDNSGDSGSQDGSGQDGSGGGSGGGGGGGDGGGCGGGDENDDPACPPSSMLLKPILDNLAGLVAQYPQEVSETKVELIR